MSQNLSVCVIGAGGAGLSAIKNSVDHGLKVTAFEMTKNIGGTWVYSEAVGADKYGNDIHSSMYKGLITNTPKETMGYADLSFPHQEYSYITSEDVLNYYHCYAEKFDLLKHIRFEHNVLRVRPLPNEAWEVVVIDLPRNQCKTLHFDAVMVCNGHNSKPNIPNFEGKELFCGKQLHAHDFRDANDFKGERVCIIGGGASALEISTLISEVTEHVTWSNHSKRPSSPFDDRIIERKPDIQSISAESVTFVDGTTQNFSTIIYATGYSYTFPFLSIECGLSMVDSSLQPLYKYCISVEHTTLAFIGLLNLIGRNLLFDYQSKFFLKFLLGENRLPTKSEMLTEMETSEWTEYGRLAIKSFPLNIDVHIKYYNVLTNEANVDPVRPVIFKMFAKALHNGIYEASVFRTVKFRIIDDDSYEIVA